MNQAVFKILITNSLKLRPSTLADFGTKLVLVRPGAVLISNN